ncbi:MAG: Zn-dependent hydrolase [Ignavibacteria bacterium]|nr:Zn-dependent hydrolase [Ignavibacteria bacterium]
MDTSRRKFLKYSTLLSGTFLIPGNPFSKNLFSAPLPALKYIPSPADWKNDNITLSWLGHSTVLINFYGKWILTDPVISKKIGIRFLWDTIGPSRMTPAALKIEEIPKPDLILLSHAHMDHTDVPTLEYFGEKYPGEIDVVTAYLTKDVIQDIEWKSVSVLDWNDETSIDGISIKAIEVKHFGWRYPWEKDRSRGYMKDGRSYNAYHIRMNGKSIVFGGDTAMTDKLDVLKNENIDIAIMPIGAYNPWKWNHCNPEEALVMAARMNAKYFIPIHTKTFSQSSEPFNEPIDWMNKSAVNYNLKIGLDNIGQTFTLE